MAAKSKVKTIKPTKAQRAAMDQLQAKTKPRKRVRLPYNPLPVTHKPLPVKGYQPQTVDAIALVNANKEHEERLLRMLDSMQGNPAFDQRWLAVARTNLEMSFMCLNRSIFRPGRALLPGELPPA